ncbi:MAG: threonylcarbamoyl-AMP synthase [Phycisphaera sp.]|nr:threonylcarbamoyl-AMP synthase [Phycisphaera sp.]
MRIITVDGTDTMRVDETVEQAGRVLASGGLVVFPTETVYGIAASAASEKGLAALRAFKERPDTQPFTIHMPTPAAAERYADTRNEPLRRLLRKVLPGPVTIVATVDEQTISARMRELGTIPGLPADARHRIYHGQTVGLRCPDHELAQRVLASIDAPIVASSANRRGQPPPMDAHEAAEAVGDAAAMVIDGGHARYAKPSTIVHVHADGRVEVGRDGVYDERFIRKLLRWTMLLVCSGNTCRSPMAEGIAKKMLAEQRGVDVNQLESAGVRVLSAGAFAMPGMPASPEAVEAMSKLGIDLKAHRSQPLTIEMVHEADVIYCMTRGHLEAVKQLVPSAVSKAQPLDPTGDVEDPIGAGKTAYQRCAELIRRRLAQRLSEQSP